MFRHRPFLILNALGALWLAFGFLSVQFGWPGFRTEPLAAFPLIGDWLGMLIAAIWVAAANVVLAVVLITRRYMRPRPAATG